MYVLFCLLAHLFSSDFSCSFFLPYCWWVLKRFVRCSQTFKSSKEKEIWKRTVRQLHHRGRNVEMRPQGGAGWCCELETLMGSLVGSLMWLLPQVTLDSQLVCRFLPSLGTAGCNLRGREGIRNKERKCRYFTKASTEAAVPRPPHCIMKWEGEIQEEVACSSFCLGGESEEQCVKWNQLIDPSCLPEQALISMWIAAFKQIFFFVAQSLFIFNKAL